MLKYDGDGGRIRKGDASSLSIFVGSLYEETNGSRASHVFLGSTRVATIRDGAIKYALHDHLGGTNVVTDDTGSIEEIIEYTPFGSIARQDNYVGGAVSANFYFTSHFRDAESGLIFMQARYYDPELGRFITPDIYVPGFANSQAFNRYSYSLNDPINRIDSSGHWSWKKFFKSFVSGFVGGVITALTWGLGAPIALALGGACLWFY